MIALQRFLKEIGEETVHHFWALENHESLLEVTEASLQMGQKVRDPIQDFIKPSS